ncbi:MULTISPECIES: hypothetical protein [unclassified Coleofasciculus]|uniref:hypothetical protein n=1 Tax=unclassified Coleofasciculus TaxID=2692782 RepID=UPI0018821CEF|nr:MULTISPECIES: hypothetical protein [unclassified Coleofasciculus]MBE9128455.1 hypothetical protein [Coleofasciculus sp. LEGE 07081]MBE9148242.1 hypothetical protein [Coleofasciculus sp. LEGE 07092]
MMRVRFSLPAFNEIVERSPHLESHDGSGKIKRSNKKYSQAIFQNGKRYNADLRAQGYEGIRRSELLG